MGTKKFSPRKKLVELRTLGPMSPSRAEITFSGKWRTGPDDPWVGPKGHPTKKRKGKPTGCVLLLRAIGSGSPRVYKSGKGPHTVTHGGTMTFFYASVNGSKKSLDNNANHPETPMKAKISYLS